MSENESVKDEGNFSSFGEEFQEKVIQALLYDHKWAQQMSEVLRVEHFDKKYLQFLAQRYFDYFSKYKCFPSLKILVAFVKDELKLGHDVIVRDMIVTFLKQLKGNPDIGDLAWVKDKALDFCRRQAMKEALYQSVDLINDGKYDNVVSVMREALSVGDLPSMGHVFFDDIEARLTPINRNVVPTGLKQLDQKGIFSGGLGKGELGVITANTGVGKSHALVMLGANAIRAGKNVVHYTFELSEGYTGIRYDSNFCDIASNEIIDNKAKVKLKYQTMKGGRLIIKEYPSNFCSVVTMRNHIEKLSLKGVKPDLLVVDYADIMKSTRAYDAPRHELKLIYEELRGLAQELAVPVWTASQAHRDSAKAEVVGLENMSEAYAKAMVADVVISFARKPMEKSSGTARLFVAKNRLGKDGLIFPVNIDTARSKITITSEEPLDPRSVEKSDQAELKEKLKERWQKVEHDGDVQLKKADK